jgi:hypothetical protein
MSSYFLVEATLSSSADALTTLGAIADRAVDRGARLVEAQVTPSGRLSAIIEAENSSDVRDALDGFDAEISFPEPAVGDECRDDNLVFRTVLANVVEPSIPVVSHARRRRPSPRKGRRPCPSHPQIARFRSGLRPQPRKRLWVVDVQRLDRTRVFRWYAF